MNLLVLAEHHADALTPATLSALAAARRLGGDIHLLIVGTDCRRIAESATRLAGVSRVLVGDATHLATPTAEDLTAVILSVLARNAYSHVLAPATSTGKSALPRVAAKLDVAPVSDVVEIVDAETFVHPIYAGNALATVRSTDPIKVITVRPTAFAGTLSETSAAPASLETISVPPADTRSRVTGRDLTASARPELASAKTVVAGGRGLGSKENFERLLVPLADKLGAAIGASRAAVDGGFVPNDLQIGQTGQIVAPQLYIAAGISGAIQHVAGMKDSRVIVAINKDPEAPIFQVADFGLVGDVSQLLPELTEKAG
ncbi:electron transfer flavoprotein subunit alpha/FixB family protein [Propionivibrio limicola]|uniref:electron transfer flavoprotein subunit alpha/FixB family protein n=1 Tax=Propionivibrio limicola TaxID=167645 RepID=UPI00129214CD|nr:FAD-binding protein [Propionivibrio limicola]